MCVIANYLYSIALINYGFDRENDWLAQTVGQLLLADVKCYGTMHEKYNSDTGTPLTPATTTKIPTAASWVSSAGICASKTCSLARRKGSG